jgi:hypothetical protein
MEGALNGLAVALLLTSLFVLRFRAWRKPVWVVFYFAFFATLELVASHNFLPPNAFGPGLGYVCLGLTPPVWIATYLLWRHERREGEVE